jgi:mono/diheme cytochrome c family protein
MDEELLNVRHLLAAASASFKTTSMRTIAITAALFTAVSAATAQESAEKLTGLARQGRALADRLCAQCHAVGRSGLSPHAGAPPFRKLGDRVDLDTFQNQLRDHFSSGHPDMPTFHFTRNDARALTAYLRSIQGP